MCNVCYWLINYVLLVSQDVVSTVEGCHVMTAVKYELNAPVTVRTSTDKRTM